MSGALEMACEYLVRETGFCPIEAGECQYGVDPKGECSRPAKDCWVEYFERHCKKGEAII